MENFPIYPSKIIECLSSLFLEAYGSNGSKKSGIFLTKRCGPALDNPSPTPIRVMVRTTQNYHYFSL